MTKLQDVVSEEKVAYLNYAIRTYWRVTDVIAGTKNALQSLPGDHPVKFDSILHREDKDEGLETIKGRISRMIEKELENFDVWTHWMVGIPGIGPVLAAELIMLYHYRYLPVCKDCMARLEKKEAEVNGEKRGTYWCPNCEKSVKGEGNLDYELDMSKDFPTISKWWAYMGRSIIDGAMPKRKKGQTLNWSPRGKKLGFLIGESFNKQQPEHLYKAVLLAEKAEYEKSQPDITKGWRHNKAKNNTVKLFLAHFWTVARTLAGKKVSEPYAMAIMGHTGYVGPFYWNGK